MKSKILEFIVRKILFNCSFTKVESDGLYIYDRHPLQMINGKGAAHDADVLMNPPIQMPFSYPTRILYECKAYDSTRAVGLNIVRSAAGLRNDINDFEIIREEFLQARQNNNRALLAVSPRKRHYYQVGLATLFGFSRPALEFAANNKIPLLSIDELFRGTGLASAINNVPGDIGTQLGDRNFELLKQELSKRDIGEVDNRKIRNLAGDNEWLSRCFDLIGRHIDNVYTGILESGELIFIRKEDEGHQEGDVLNSSQRNNLTAQIHWSNNEPERWHISFNGYETKYFFYLPGEIAAMWKSYDDAKISALQIKGNRFARFFVFNKRPDDSVMPFKLIRLDKEWLQQLINRQSDI